jgi:hypothetical protein
VPAIHVSGDVHGVPRTSAVAVSDWSVSRLRRSCCVVPILKRVNEPGRPAGGADDSRRGWSADGLGAAATFTNTCKTFRVTCITRCADGTVHARLGARMHILSLPEPLWVQIADAWMAPTCGPLPQLAD